MSESNRNPPGPRRRSVAVELTEQEIQDFIAHSDSDDGNGAESDASDWDDLREADLDEVELLLNAASSASNNSAQHLRQFTSTSSSNLEMQPSCSKTGLKDVGVDSLFGSSVSNSNGIPDEDKTDKKNLFGEDSDSEFELEGLDDPEDKQDRTLSKYGIEIQASLSAAELKKKERSIERQIEQTVQNPNQSDSKPASNLSVSSTLAACAMRRKSALDALNKATMSHSPISLSQPSNQPKRSNLGNAGSSGSKKPTNDATGDYWIAKPTLIKVYRSVISSELWSNRTSDRQVFNLAQLMRRCRTTGFSTKQSIVMDDSVVVGVIGSKLEPRRSRNDRIYSVWCLSDLENIGPGASEGCVKLMLFGQCHEKLWKESEGTVVAILNPRILSSNAGSSNGKDVTLTLDSPLHAMILGQSPDYGICSATTKSGQKCFQVINKNVCRYCDYHVKKAYFEASSIRPGFVTTSLSNPNLGARSSSRYSGDIAPIMDPGVYSLPIRPNVQSMGPRKRIQLTMSKLTAAGYEVDLSTGLAGNTNKHMQHQLAETESQTNPTKPASKTVKNLNDAEEKLIAALRKPSAGSLNLLKHLTEDPLSTPSSTPTSTSSPTESQPTKKRKLRDDSSLKESKPTVAKSASFKDFFASMATQRKPAPSLVSNKPDFIDLGPLPGTISGARLRAINLVNSQGGVKALDEKNRLRRHSDMVTKMGLNRSSSSPISRILGDSTSTNSGNISIPSDPDKTPNQESLASKDKKRLRLERLEKLTSQIKQGSAHANLVVELENQTEDARLANLEKRDQFEQKLLDQTQEACTFVCCETCDYRAFKAAPDCLKNSHNLKYRKGHKRYFSCRNCHKRTISLDRYPTKSCVNCGESLFEKTGILAERKGPKLPHENLLSRGLEEKFLG